MPDDQTHPRGLSLDQVLQGDCIQVLTGLPEKSVDMIFADPPYNLQLQGDLWRPNQTKVAAVVDEWDRFSSFADYDRFTREWLSACRRVLKDTGTLWVIGTYHNIFRVGAILQDLDYWILNDVVWVKANPMPNFHGRRLTNAQETLIWAQKERGASYNFNYHGVKALNGDLQMRSDWYIPLCTGKERLKVNGVKAHATQKPEALLYRVIVGSTNPGDVILDPFFGSGTTGVVAKKLARRWIGIEIDPGYVRLARRRIAAVAAPTDETVFEDDRSRPPRLPFGALLENGYLQPGQLLYFGARQEYQAVILANGHLRCNGFSGSIHQVAKSLKNAPCNGWDVWFYRDGENSKWQAIDVLRRKLLASMGNEENP